jgi:uncharacterized protein YyaL (SSP411 family)
MPTNKKIPNRLAKEKSPYLLQHQYNPVDWFPWGAEAFEKAKREDKPIFLSIGYSTCHWCHVMERESFEDETVAAALNENFVSIKADREERPDVDAFYMDACVTQRGSGGWPLSCFLMHDKKPFFAGTYFPKNDGVYGVGFLTILGRIHELWSGDRADLTSYADQITRYLDRRGEGDALDPDRIQAAFRQLEGEFDPKYGGFGAAPKFPSVQHLLFLLRYGLEFHGEPALKMARKTLDGMFQGGIYDHIGGGFCRYSTDDAWLIPHFEKMMTDNAMHIMAYSEAAALFGGPYAQIARDITRFCTREMLDASGGFYTAMDADSEGEEGKYYAFTPDEVNSVLGEEDGKRYCGLYHITRRGNFEGKSIPNLIDTGLHGDEAVFARLCNEKMLRCRSKRIPPFRDEKVLTLVNGLMIAALAIEGRTLRDGSAVKLAEGCADFLLSALRKDGRLLSRWRDGEAGIPAGSDDYACLIWGLLELYETTLAPEWLEKAVRLTGEMDALFRDQDGDGYFLSGSDVDELPVRQKNIHDGALPSGNSIMALNLLRLSRITAQEKYEQTADQIFRLAAPMLNRQPMACCFLLCALTYLKNGGTEVILANGNGFDRLKDALPSFLPFSAVAACGEGFEKVLTAAPYLENYHPVDGKAAAYVCRNGSCLSPITSPEKLAEVLAAEQ